MPVTVTLDGRTVVPEAVERMEAIDPSSLALAVGVLMAVASSPTTVQDCLMTAVAGAAPPAQGV